MIDWIADLSLLTWLELYLAAGLYYFNRALTRIRAICDRDYLGDTIEMPRTACILAYILWPVTCMIPIVEDWLKSKGCDS